MKALLDATLALRRALEAELKPSRELSLAITKLEECAHWAGCAYVVQNGVTVTVDQATAILAPRG